MPDQRHREKAIIAVGSNLGNSIATISRAVTLLEVRLAQSVRRSNLYETAPMYAEDQPRYVNGVVSVELSTNPFALLALMLDVEARFGRVRHADERFGARTIDLDLIALGDRVIDSSALSLPHPRCHERAFVLRPLIDIEPDWVHPTRRESAATLLDALESSDPATRTQWNPIDDPRWRPSSSSAR